MLLLLASLALQHPPERPPDLAKRAHTYSIVAYDSVTGDLGVAVQSKFPNVGGSCPGGRRGSGGSGPRRLGTTIKARRASGRWGRAGREPERSGTWCAGAPGRASGRV